MIRIHTAGLEVQLLVEGKVMPYNISANSSNTIVFLLSDNRFRLKTKLPETRLKSAGPRGRLPRVDVNHPTVFLEYNVDANTTVRRKEYNPLLESTIPAMQEGGMPSRFSPTMVRKGGDVTLCDKGVGRQRGAPTRWLMSISNNKKIICRH